MSNVHCQLSIDKVGENSFLLLHVGILNFLGTDFTCLTNYLIKTGGEIMKRKLAYKMSVPLVDWYILRIEAIKLSKDIIRQD